MNIVTNVRRHFFIILLVGGCNRAIDAFYQDQGMFFCIATDATFFQPARNLIASLHKVNFNEINQIAVFDIGMTCKQREEMQKIAKVTVYDPEIIHKDMLKEMITRPNGKKGRGYYTWKPVVVKQALDMFPYVFYIDAGVTVHSKFDLIFDYLREHGYFFVDCGHTIRQMMTRPVIERFNLNDSLLDSYGLWSGGMGLSREIYDSFIMPVYELAHDISYFIDDGSAPNGFGWARYDQKIYSMQARLCNFTVLEGQIDGQTSTLSVAGQLFPFQLYTLLSRSRFKYKWDDMKKYIHKKGEYAFCGYHDSYTKFIENLE